MEDKFNLPYFGKQIWGENRLTEKVNVCELMHPLKYIKWVIGTPEVF